MTKYVTKTIASVKEECVECYDYVGRDSEEASCTEGAASIV